MQVDHSAPILVAVGASAGGVPALREFLSRAPAEAAYLVILHQPADSKSVLSQLLDRAGPLQAEVAQDGQSPQAGKVLVLGPGQEIRITGGRVALRPRPDGIHIHRPIDALLESMAEDVGSRSLAVILSGSGQDGSKGARRVREVGGLVFTQDLSAEFESMPRMTRATAGADWVGDPTQLAEKLEQLIGAGGDRNVLGVPETEIASLEFHELAANLARHGRMDATIFDQDVLSNRWQLMREQGDVPATWSETTSQLLQTDALLKDEKLLRLLEEDVLPTLMAEPEPPRVWMPCCGAGFDIHVISALLCRIAAESKVPPRFSLFATDVDKQIFQGARLGQDVLGTYRHLPEELRVEFLDETPGRVNIRPSVREHSVFAVHDLVRDVPFARMRMIVLGPTARLLRPEVRQEAVEQLSFSLRPGSMLLVSFPLSEVPVWLERSEAYPGLFVSRGSQRPGRKVSDKVASMARPAPLAPEQRLIVLAAQALLADQPGGTAILDQDLRPLQVSGRLEQLLKVPSSTRDVALSAMFRSKPLSDVITKGLQQARVRGGKVQEEVELGGDSYRVVVHPLGVGNDHAMGYVVQVQHWETPEATEVETSGSNEGLVTRLRGELTETRQQLAQAVDSLEAKSEQLQSANEELLASNEELHTVNEELFTVNEELYTVNLDLEGKLDQLTTLGQDLESIMRGTQVGVLFLDRDLCIRRFTPHISSLLPLQDNDLGRHLSELHFSTEGPRIAGLISAVADTGEPRETELFIAQAGWRLLRVLPIHEEGSRGVLLISIDIHRLKLAESSLQRRSEELETLLHAHPDEVYRIGPDGVIREQKGYVRAGSRVGSRLMQHLSPEGRSKLDQAFSRLEAGAKEYWAEYADQDGHGRQVDMELRVVPVPDSSDQTIVLLRNITTLKGAERQRLEIVKRAEQNQHLESLGVLAGGIAHDFNNILAGIQGNAELAQASVPPESDCGDRLLRIQLACEQAAGLCRQMLNYAGKGQHNDEPLDLSVLADETVPLVDHQLRSHGGHLDLELDMGLPKMMGDPARLRQVILNLVLNAIEALPERGGWIRVRTSMSNMAEEAALSLQNKAAPDSGKYLVFSVQDNGHGMDEQTRNRIFQPFYSTKFSGRGLGLAAVHGIVRSHRGHIDVQSTPGEGTCFRVYLPFTTVKDATIPALPPRSRKRGATPLQGQILVADDEEQIRLVTEALLSNMGYQVTAVKSGKEAVQIVSSREDKFLAAILDITMPDMSGIEAATEILRHRPGLPILTMSGFLVEDLDILPAAETRTGFLQKPFTADALRDALEDVLQPPADSTNSA